MHLELKETLGFGDGQLIATTAGYRVQFIFTGPDRRYNPTILTFYPSDMGLLQSAYEEGIDRYLHVKNVLSPATEFSEYWHNDIRIAIRVSAFASGICLGGYRHPVNLKKDADIVSSRVRWAKQRGPELAKSVRQMIP